jgi:hypothetical protein
LDAAAEAVLVESLNAISDNSLKAALTRLGRAVLRRDGGAR